MENHWIQAPLREKYTGALCFVRNILLRDAIFSASVTISSVGIYELSINGQKVGDRVLTPGFTSYNKRGIQYQEYDITDHVSADNTIRITVAPGWAVGHLGYAGNDCIYADHVSTCAKFTVSYEDGTQEVYTHRLLPPSSA